MAKNNSLCRIVLTGGPGAGKTTAADLFRREIGEKVVVVPEAATLLFSGGFPRTNEKQARMGAQRAIYSVQTNLEDVQSSLFPKRILICDRGTVDSAIYWPDGAQDFFNSVGSSLENEFDRYDSVVFFETAAVGHISIEGNNPIRNESLEEAIKLDKKLKAVWEQHPNFYFIPNNKSFLSKMNEGLKCIQSVVQKHL